MSFLRLAATPGLLWDKNQPGQGVNHIAAVYTSGSVWMDQGRITIIQQSRMGAITV